MDDGDGPYLIIDDGSDANGLIHLGVEMEEQYSITNKMSDFGVLDFKNNELRDMYNILQFILYLGFPSESHIYL